MALVSMVPAVACIGEAMLELSGPPDSMRMAVAGDALNTAIGLARLGVPTAFVSALGDDPYSDMMLEGWAAEGLDTGAVARIAGALPGLYAIRLDDRGERQFHYWRQESAARRMLDGARADQLATALAGVRWIYLSGITLAILVGERRARLIALLADCAAAGASLIVDGNYRATLWPDRSTARAAITAATRMAQIALPTFEDEAALFEDATPADTIARLRALGVPEIVVKHGAEGCVVAADERVTPMPVPAVVRPVDTSGAGDAFNAGYIAARLAGAAPVSAAGAGHRMAALTLAHPGALPPRAAVLASGILP